MKSCSNTERLVEYKRHAGADPRGHAEDTLYSAVNSLRPSYEAYEQFQKLFNAGCTAKYYDLEIGRDKFSVVQLCDKEGRQILTPNKTKKGIEYLPEGFVQLPDDNGTLTLSDFYELIRNKTFEFGGAQNPDAYLKRFNYHASAVPKTDVTEQFRQDLDNSVISLYSNIAGTVGRENFPRILRSIGSWDRDIYKTLETAYTNQFGKTENLASSLYNILEQRADLILPKKRTAAAEPLEKLSLCQKIKTAAQENLREIAQTVLATGMFVSSVSLATLFNSAAIPAKAEKSGSLENTIAHPNINLSARSNESLEPVWINGSICGCNPAIYGNNIVWSDDEWGDDTVDVYMYNIPTKKTIQITNGSKDQSDPAIYGDNIVWTSGDIYRYNISTNKTTQITNDSNTKASPVIYGDEIVWVSGDRIDEGSVVRWDANIYVYNIPTEKTIKITNDSNDQADPAIYGNNIVWSDNTDNHVYMYNIPAQKTYQITSGNADRAQFYPAIYGDKIVFLESGWKDNSVDIYVYDIPTKKTIQITNDSRVQYKPVIYEDKIVWVDEKNGNKDIYMNNISTKKTYQITNDSKSQYDTVIYRDTIVWKEDFIGLYMLNMSGKTLTPVPEPQPQPQEPNYIPTLVFDSREKYFPIDPYGDGDSDLSNNKENWENGKFPAKPVVWTKEIDYSQKKSAEHPDGFKVKERWVNYAYNDWGADKHPLDWEQVCYWIDNKDGNVFYCSASMHLWDNEYGDVVYTLNVENGGHGMSKDTNMIDHIPMDFKTVGKAINSGDFEAKSLDELKTYSESGFPGERGKCPTLQQRCIDPDGEIRLKEAGIPVVEAKVLNSPELRAKDLEGKITGMVNGQVKEEISNSKYSAEDERIVLINPAPGLTFETYGLKDESYNLQIKKATDTKEEQFVKTLNIKQGDLQKITDWETEFNPAKEIQKPKQPNDMTIKAGEAAAVTISFLLVGAGAYKVRQRKLKQRPPAVLPQLQQAPLPQPIQNQYAQQTPAPIPQPQQIPATIPQPIYPLPIPNLQQPIPEKSSVESEIAKLEQLGKQA